MTNEEVRFDDDNFNLQNNLLAKNFSETIPKTSNQTDNKIINTNNNANDDKSFYCEPCNLKLNSKLIYKQHLEGIKHKKKLNQIELINQYNKEQSVFNNINLNTTLNNQNANLTTTKNQPTFRCDYCDLSLTSQINYDQHMSGRNHRKKVELLSRNNNQPNHSPSSITIQSLIQSATNQDQNNNNNSYNCGICQMSMSGKDQLAAHLIGKKHMKKLSSLNSSNFVNNVPTTSTNTIDDSNLIANNQHNPINTNINNQNSDTNNLQVNPIPSSQTDNKELVHQQIENANNTITTINNTSNGDNFYCIVCDVKATSQDHLNSHYSGKKHLAKLKSLSTIPAIAKTKIKDDDSKFDHLNIAWSKYEIDPSKKADTNYLYNFYCQLCNKYIQRKLQLVDHLKSKKHHVKIIAARSKKEATKEDSSTTANTNEIKRPTLNKPLFKAKIKRKFQPYKRNKPIQFVPATTTTTTTTNQFAAMNLGNQPINNTLIDSNIPDLSNYGYGYTNYSNQSFLIPNYSYLNLPANQSNTNNYFNGHNNNST